MEKELFSALNGMKRYKIKYRQLKRVIVEQKEEHEQKENHEQSETENSRSK